MDFHDSVVAEARPELAVKRADGSVWRGDGFLLWEHEGLYGTRADALKDRYARMQARRVLR